MSERSAPETTRGPSDETAENLVPDPYKRLYRSLFLVLVAFIAVTLIVIIALAGFRGFPNVDVANTAIVQTALVGLLGTLLGTSLGLIRKPPIVSTDVQFLFTESPELPKVTEAGSTEQDSEPTRTDPESAETQTSKRFHSDEVGQEYIWQYFEGLAGIIYSRASQIAREQERSIQSKDVAQACAEFAPGNPFPTEQSLGQRIASSITGITIISAILAIVFGLIGFLGLRYGGQGADTVKAFIDIAQIFAGAVVGSTGAAAVSGK